MDRKSKILKFSVRFGDFYYSGSKSCQMTLANFSVVELHYDLRLLNNKNDFNLTLSFIKFGTIGRSV